MPLVPAFAVPNLFPFYFPLNVLFSAFLALVARSSEIGSGTSMAGVFAEGDMQQVHISLQVANSAEYHERGKSQGVE